MALLLCGLLAPPAAASWELGQRALAEGDYERAAGQFQRAAPRGDARAQFALGILYLLGAGVERDEERGAGWVRRAARNGLTAAYTLLGRMHLTGWGVPQSDAEALQWYRRAAAYGDDDAQASLGILHATGRGVSPSLVEAATWLTLAREGGNAAAGKYLAGVEGELTEPQRRVVERRVAAFEEKAMKPVGEDPMRIAKDLYEDLGLEHWGLAHGHSWIR